MAFGDFACVHDGRSTRQRTPDQDHCPRTTAGFVCDSGEGSHELLMAATAVNALLCVPLLALCVAGFQTAPGFHPTISGAGAFSAPARRREARWCGLSAQILKSTEYCELYYWVCSRALTVAMFARVCEAQQRGPTKRKLPWSGPAPLGCTTVHVFSKRVMMSVLWRARTWSCCSATVSQFSKVLYIVTLK